MFGRKKKDQQERSASGAPIWRHEAPDRDFTLAIAGDEDRRAAVEAHYEHWLGKDYVVWHEIISDLVHIDVLMWRPSPERPLFTFATLGMSDQPMTVPPGATSEQAAPFAELLVSLPPDWPVPTEAYAVSPWADDRAYAPVRFLKYLARLPHEYSTWLGFGHTVPNGDPPGPFHDRTRLAGWLIVPPVTIPPAFADLAHRGQRIAIFGVVCLTADEMAFKLDHGSSALLDRLDDAGVNEVLEIGRASSLRRQS